LCCVLSHLGGAFCALTSEFEMPTFESAVSIQFDAVSFGFLCGAIVAAWAIAYNRGWRFRWGKGWFDSSIEATQLPQMPSRKKAA